MHLGTIFTTLMVIDNMTPAIRSAGYQLTSLGQGLVQAGVLASGFSLALASAGKATIQFSADFERSTAQLVALAGVTKDELEGVRQHLLDLAPAVGIGPVALSEALYVVSSTMGDTTTALQILDVAVKGSAIGMGDAKDVAKALVAIVNSYGQENITAARAGDILTRAIRDGGAEAAELAPRLAKVIPFASQLGISFEEVGANIATMTKLGVPASQAVTSLASVFAALARAVPRGQKALAEVGMTYAGLRAEIRERGLMAALVDLRETFAGNEEGLIDVVGRLEALKNVLGTTGPMASTYSKTLDEVKNSHGELGDSMSVVTNTLSFQWKQFQAAIEAVWIELGTAFMPVLKMVVSGLKEFIPFLKDLVAGFNILPTPVKAVVAVFLAFLGLSGPVLIFLGMLGMSIGQLSRGMQVFRAAAAEVVVSTAASGTAAAAASIPVNVLGASYVKTASGLYISTSASIAQAEATIAVGAASGAAVAPVTALNTAVKMGPWGWLINILSLAAGAYLLFSGSAEDSIETSKESVEATLSNIEKLGVLRQELVDSAVEHRNLKDVRQGLIDINPAYIGLLDAEVGSHNALFAAIEATTLAEKATLQIKKDLLILRTEEIKIKAAAIAQDNQALQVALRTKRLPGADPNSPELNPGSLKNMGAAFLETDAALTKLNTEITANNALVGRMTEVLDKNVFAVNEAGRALKMYDAVIKNLKGGSAEFDKGMKLAGKSSEDLANAMKSTKLMAALLKEVQDKLIASTQNLSGAKDGATKAEAAHEKQLKKGWDSILDNFKSLQKARDEALKDSAAVDKKIETLNADTQARMLELDGKTYESKIVLINNWKQQEIKALGDQNISWMKYVNGVLAIVKNADAQILSSAEDRSKEMRKIIDQEGDYIAASLARTEAKQEEYAASVARLNGDTYGASIATINRNAIKAEAANQKHLDTILDQIKKNGAQSVYWKAVYSNIAIALSKAETDAIKKLTDAAIAEAARAEKIKKQQEMNSLVEEFISLLDQIGEASSEFRSLFSLISNGVSAWLNMTKAVQAYENALTKAGKAQAVIQGLSSFISATGSGSTGNRATGGAMSGAALGTAIAPGVGTVIGAVAGGLVGLVRGLTDTTAAMARWEAQMNRLAANDELRKSLNETYGSAERVAILFDALGIANIQLGDSEFVAKQKADLLNAAMKKLTTEMDEIGTSTRIASAELIAFRNAVPTDPLVVEFVLQQVQSAGKNIGGMLESLQASATAAAKKAALALDPDADVTDIVGQVTLTAAGAAAMASILIASFDGTTASLRAMAPALAILEAAMKNSGITGSAAFQQIAALAKLATDEITGPMIDAMDQGTLALINMYNSGFLTQEMFSGIVGEVMAQRQALLDAGATSEQVNAVMQPSLQRIWQLVKDGKLEVDATTQALLDEAEAQGLVGDRFRDSTDRMVRALERLAEMFETVFAEQLTDAARRGAAAAQAELDRIRMPPFEVPGRGTPGNPGPQPGGPGGGGTPPAFGYSGYSAGRGYGFGFDSQPYTGTSSRTNGSGFDSQTIEISLDSGVLVKETVHGMKRYLSLRGKA